MGTNSHQDYLRIRTFPSLDGLRCFAIVAVVFHHAGPTTASVPMSTRGFLGVDLFFVLSGFLIVTLLLRERDRNGAISLGAFYMRRALRIFPLYYAIVLGLAALVALRPQMSMADTYVDNLPYLLTYTSNWVDVGGLVGVTWSLAAEEQFYLVWPTLEHLFPPSRRGGTNRRLLGLWVAAVAVNQLFNFGILDPWLPEGKRHDDLEILQATFTPILLGVALAHVLHRADLWARVAPFLRRRSLPLLLLVVLAVLVNGPGDISGWPRLAIHVVMVLLLGSLVVRSDTLGGLLTWPPIARIGVVSYGIYLLHMFVRHGADVLLARAPTRIPGDLFVAVLVGSWIAAELSYRFFEQHFLTLKKRFTRLTPHAGAGSASPGGPRQSP